MRALVHAIALKARARSIHNPSKISTSPRLRHHYLTRKNAEAKPTTLSFTLRVPIEQLQKVVPSISPLFSYVAGPSTKIDAAQFSSS